MPPRNGAAQDGQNHDAVVQAFIANVFLNQKNAIPEDVHWKPQLQQCFDGLQMQQCSICRLPGHRAAQCWINGAVYEWCRTNNKASLNYSWRGYIKLARKVEAIEARKAFEKDAQYKHSELELAYKTGLAEKRQRK